MKKVILIFIIVCIQQYSHSQPNSWTQKASLPGASRFVAMSFANNQFGYVCAGADSNDFPMNDNWQYDPVLDSWTQKSNIMFSRRVGGIAFSVGTKSYCGFGIGVTGSTLKDLWEYDSATDSWTQKSSCPGPPRALTNSFVIGNMAYITCGAYDVSSNDVLRDCWEFDAQNNSWIAKSNFPGVSRLWPVSFVVDGEAYVGTGNDSLENALSDFYKYNNLTDTWTQLSNSPVPRAGAIGLSLFNTGYIGLGFNSNSVLDDLWYYDKATDTWNPAATFPGASRDAPYMFVLNNKLYVGGGEDQNLDPMRDLWEYNPDTNLTGISMISNSIHEVAIIKSDNTLNVQFDASVHLPAKLEIYSITGTKILSANINDLQKNLTIKENGIYKYVYYVEDKDGKTYNGSVKFLKKP